MTKDSPSRQNSNTCLYKCSIHTSWQPASRALIVPNKWWACYTRAKETLKRFSESLTPGSRRRETRVNGSDLSWCFVVVLRRCLLRRKLGTREERGVDWADDTIVIQQRYIYDRDSTSLGTRYIHFLGFVDQPELDHLESPSLSWSLMVDRVNPARREPGVFSCISTSTAARLQKVIKDLNKYLQGQEKGPWPQNKVSALDRGLGEIGRILEKRNVADQTTFRLAGGLTTLCRIMLAVGDSTAEVAPVIPVKSLIHCCTVFRLACKGCYDNCHYMLFSNKAGTLVDLLSHQLNMLIPEDLNVVLSSSGGATSLHLPYDPLATSLMQLIATVLSVLSKHNPMAISSEASAERMSTSGDAFMSRANDIVRNANLFDCRKRDDTTQLISTFQVTGLVGIVSLMYGMLLHSGTPPRGENTPPELPAHSLTVATVGFRMLNHLAMMDLQMLQNSLGEEGTSLEIRHISSYLLWYCSHWTHEELLHEVILSVGYFTVLNNDNQVSGSCSDGIGVSISDGIEVSINDGIEVSIIDSIEVSISDGIKVSISDSMKVSISDSIKVSISYGIKVSISDGIKFSISYGIKVYISDGIEVSISDGIKVSISDGIEVSIIDSIEMSISDGIKVSISDSMKVSISDSIKVSISYGIKVSVSDGIKLSIIDGMKVSISDGINDGIDVSISDGIDVSISDGIGVSISDGIGVSISDCIEVSISDGIEVSIIDSIEVSISNGIKVSISVMVSMCLLVMVSTPRCLNDDVSVSVTDGTQVSCLSFAVPKCLSVMRLTDIMAWMVVVNLYSACFCVFGVCFLAVSYLRMKPSDVIVSAEVIAGSDDVTNLN
ncbi:hypothetical protein LSH36_148g05042 [Paralvinella palmiformis]|uniref:Uncharacterized protein n=1 Tax=Paralvinella palmiformis TaxID=53620 RepID=A0AAD9JVX6_9ANNE|nr:hypothetical protein LSH36_148g05042 [Paralvinella palmiformis]